MCLLVTTVLSHAQELKDSDVRQRILINDDWRFFKYDDPAQADSLTYDVRPETSDNSEYKVADAKPTDAVHVQGSKNVLKAWILPTANTFIKNPSDRHVRPEGNPGADFPFVSATFDETSWERVDLPHDWAIKGPFMTGPHPQVGGGMGRLPVNGVAWYRKKLHIPATDRGKSIYLQVDGAMSYAMVWLNGILVGGWPYGYNTWTLDLTPYIQPGKDNQLAIRVDNPNHSARWYPGAGIYRNVYLIKANRVHTVPFGTVVTTSGVTTKSATINVTATVANHTQATANVVIENQIFAMDVQGRKGRTVSVAFTPRSTSVPVGETLAVQASAVLVNPRLWGPPPTQRPHLYVCETTIRAGGKVVDRYETRFGIRVVEFDANRGLSINGEKIKIKGVNQHHDLGALGAAFNVRAAERQLEILREMGCNAVRMSHNPPAPELLELTDRMGFLVVDEIFDSWERKKTALDFHLIFPDWHEADLRAFIRRDRNSPSVIIWSFGNEVGEQYTGEAGSRIAMKLHSIIKEEDITRPTTIAMNYAKPDMPISGVADLIGLNYQGEGIRQDPEFEGTERIRTKPQYDDFHKMFPDKLIFSSETASAFSSRGVYLFPVTKAVSAPVRDGRGGDSRIHQVSGYELHAVDFGASADKVFASLDSHPFVAGEFVWTGWDHLGEPTPYYDARSAYCGIIDLAGFRKDRFYLYQARWRPDLPMAHILPHWTWPERVGMNTPVHVFTSGDEAELFLNGKSLGRRRKDVGQYRLRWDSVVYESGVLSVVAYKKGKKWAESSVRTAGAAASLEVLADRKTVKVAEGTEEIHLDAVSAGRQSTREKQNTDADLIFVTVRVVDEDGTLLPRADNLVEFSVEGPGDLVATDNGDATGMESFQASKRKAFNGLCLGIVRARPGADGEIVITVRTPGLPEKKIKVRNN